MSHYIMLYEYGKRTRDLFEVACTQAVGWRVEKTGIRDEVAILNSRGQVWAGWRVDKVSSYPGARASKIQDGARLANGGFSAMKPPVTACKQAIFEAFLYFVKFSLLHFERKNSHYYFCILFLLDQLLESNLKH